jgi:hypothetical protein
MDKYLTVDEFIEVITRSLKGTLDRDFSGGGKSHIVDLMTHATTGMEWMYQFVDAYGSIEYERHLQAKAPVEDIEPIVKSGKKAK